MDVQPLSPALGAEIRGLDLAHVLDPAAAAALRKLWLDHGVLLIRDQRLEVPQLVAFSRLFGELEPPPASEAGTREELAGEPVWYISNVVEDGRPIGSLGYAEAEWHTDMSYLEEPPTASILHARDVPATGGNTSFASMYAAFDALPESLRARLEGIALRHDSSTTSAGELRRGAAAVADVTRASGARHPAIRTHPETGRRCLYLGRRRNAYVEGLGLAESESLLDEVWAHCRDRRFAWEHAWRPGDLVIWDNRCVIHRRDAFDPAARRVMLRTQVRGDRPF
jgi:taurine dioxygenase